MYKILYLPTGEYVSTMYNLETYADALGIFNVYNFTMRKSTEQIFITSWSSFDWKGIGNYNYGEDYTWIPKHLLEIVEV